MWYNQKFAFVSLAALAAIFSTTSSASAQQANNSGGFSINEFRFGGLNQDPTPLGREDGGFSAAGEILFTPFNFDPSNRFDNAFWEAITRPRLHFGASVNTGGKTSYAYTGLTWRGNIGPVLFIEGSFGAGVHNGELGTLVRGSAQVPGKPGRAALGLRFLFRESLAIGLQINEKFSVVANIEHLSHGDFISGLPNNGLTSYGLKVGYKF